MTQPELATVQSGFGGRGYKHPHTGQRVPSVTTVLRAAAQPGITQWAVDQTAAYAVANIDGLMSRSETQGWNSLRWYHKRDPLPLEAGYDVRNYHLGVLNDAAELGTAMHEWVAADLDDSQTYPDVSMQTQLFWDMIPVWNQWHESNFVETLYSEVTVWNAEEGYAGTFDWLGYINGKLTLLDFKTSRNVWPEHKRQVAALLNCPELLVKLPDGTWESREWPEGEVEVGLLHIRPDDVANNGTFIPAYCEYVPVDDLDLHYQAFLGCLNMKKADIAVAAREKERAKASLIQQKESSTAIVGFV